MRKSKYYITVPLEVEVEVTASFYAGFKGSHLEPPEPASFDFLDCEMKKPLDAYVHEAWESIEGDLHEQMADAAEDYDGA